MFASWRRGAVVIIGAIVIVAGITFAFWPEPVPVDIARVTRGSLEVTVNDEGVSRIRDVYVISAPVSGRLLRAPREIGDEVVAGQTIVAVIRPTPPAFLDERGRREAEARVRAAEAAAALGEAEVNRAEAELAFARSDLDRAERLARTATISQRALDEAKLNVEVKQAALATARANLAVRREELESARARLIEPGAGFNGDDDTGCCVTVRSPANGRVLKIMAESEQVVAAGTPLLEVGDPHRLEIAVELLSSDAVKVEDGAPALIERWGGDETLAARVRRVDPAGFEKVSALGVEEQRVEVILDPVDPEDPGWRRLGHEFRIFARIIVWRADDIVTIPLSALFRVGERWATFVYEDGRARRRIVEIGARNDRSAEVRAGLEAGELVIVHPSDRVDNGLAVVPREPLPEGAGRP